MDIINITDLTEQELAKVKQKLCPKCNDGLREEQIKDKIVLVCVNYYCRWEVCIDNTSPTISSICS